MECLQILSCLIKILLDWDVGEVTNMSSMFEGAKKFNNGDNSLNDWDVGEVIDMGSMFKDTKVFNQLIGMWDARNVTTMQSMFEAQRCLISFFAEGVTNCSFMFKNAVNFNGDVTTFFTDKVTTMESMFEGALNFDQESTGSWCGVQKQMNIEPLFLGEWVIKTVLVKNKVF